MKNLKSLIIVVLMNGITLNAQTKDTAVVSPATISPAITSSNDMERPVQFTFITPLGTNGIDAHKITNKVSFNVLAGVSRGVEGFEAGGLANVTLKNVSGVQMAGFTNVVLGDVRGSQLAGYFNYCGGDFKGAAFAGMANLGLGELRGGQFAGAFNLNKKGGEGVQIAGYCNVMLGDLKGTQISAFSNVLIGDLKGTQISAFSNITAGNVEGSQISAMVNCAKKVKGLQLGFINIADSVDGVSIGFLNFVKKGMHQIEVSGDELFYSNLSLRTGTKSFYNIFTAGVQPGTSLWHFGYGVGSSFIIKNKWSSDVSATFHHVSNGNFQFSASDLYRFYWGVEYKVKKKFAIAAGPTLNIYVTDTYDTEDYSDTYSKIAPYHFSNATSGYGFNTKMWLGGRVALRFL